jgi:hypothetical protein
MSVFKELQTARLEPRGRRRVYASWCVECACWTGRHGIWYAETTSLVSSLLKRRLGGLFIRLLRLTRNSPLSFASVIERTACSLQ